MHSLAFLEGDLVDLAIDARAYENGVPRLGDAEPIQIDGEVGPVRRRDVDWHGAVTARLSG